MKRVLRTISMKILALDLGDKWVGSALSDALKLFARPYKTVGLYELTKFLEETFLNEKIDTVLIGYPKTMKGTESEQTKKVVAQKEELEKLFPEKKFILWDERLSSKRAEQTKKTSSKEAKLQSHSIAAAFILESYLNYLQFTK